MNAADYYGLEELKHACSGFIQVTSYYGMFCSYIKLLIVTYNFNEHE